MSLDHPILADQRQWKASLALLIERVPVGLVFVLAGWMKVHDMGVGKFVEQASGTIPSYLPHALGRAYLHALPWVELISGVLLIVGQFTRTTAVIQSLILISIMMAVTGVHGEQGGIHSNVFLLAMTIAIVLLGPGRWSGDGVVFGRRRR